MLTDEQKRHRDRETARARYALNREKERERTRAWREANRDKARAATRRWHEENKTDRNARNKRWREENPDAERQRKKAWRTKNPEYHRVRMQTDVFYRISKVVRNRLTNALRAKGIAKTSSSAELIGCSVEELKAHLEGQFQAGMSWANHGEWHVDHKRALAAFDLSDPTQMAEACHFTNLQPLWAVDNLRKGAC